MRESVPVTGTEEVLAQIARNLYDAAEMVQASAQREGPGSANHLWGLALFIAAAQATSLLSDATTVQSENAGLGHQRAVQHGRDVAGLLRVAYDQTALLPVGAQYPGISELIVAVGDLARRVRV